MRKNLYIFSGIRPGHSGVGNLITSLLDQSLSIAHYRIKFVFGKNGGPNMRNALHKINIILILKEAIHRTKYFFSLWRAIVLPRMLDREEVILISPPTLGLDFCRKFITRRKKITWIYVVDAGFFCIRSANHMPGEDAACLRCLGGQWANIFLHSCPPFPGKHKGQKMFYNFLIFLKEEAKKKRVGFMVQNNISFQLIKKHFGSEVIVSKVGLWADFDGIEKCVRMNDKDESTLSVCSKYDVVFHGSFGEAKGALWALRLADKCPQYSFLFPCVQSSIKALKIKVPKNCYFEKLSWNDGLMEYVMSATLILCPSLWSAPIESALIKSIAFGRKTAVVNEPTAYSSEIPDDIVLKLPRDINTAATTLERYFKMGAEVPQEKKEKWISQFVSENKYGLKRMLRVTHLGM